MLHNTGWSNRLAFRSASCSSNRRQWITRAGQASETITPVTYTLELTDFGHNKFHTNAIKSVKTVNSYLTKWLTSSVVVELALASLQSFPFAPEHMAAENTHKEVELQQSPAKIWSFELSHHGLQLTNNDDTIINHFPINTSKQCILAII